MPFLLEQVSKTKYKLSNPITGRVHSYSSTMKNIKKQIDLIKNVDRRRK